MLRWIVFAILQLSSLVKGNAEKIILSKLDFDSKEIRIQNPPIDLVLRLPVVDVDAASSESFLPSFLNLYQLATYRHHYYQLLPDREEGEPGLAVPMKPIYAQIDEASFNTWDTVEVRICWSAKVTISISSPSLSILTCVRLPLGSTRF